MIGGCDGGMDLLAEDRHLAGGNDPYLDDIAIDAIDADLDSITYYDGLVDLTGKHKHGWYPV
jgi:hypothetical protein